ILDRNVTGVQTCALPICPVGTLAALRQKSLWDTGSMFILTLGHALPNYLTGVFLVLIFSGALRILPAAGWSGPQNLVLPVIALEIGRASCRDSTRCSTAT